MNQELIINELLYRRYYRCNDENISTLATKISDRFVRQLSINVLLQINKQADSALLCAYIFFSNVDTHMDRFNSRVSNVELASHTTMRFDVYSQ